MLKENIILIEDDSSLYEGLIAALRLEGYQTRHFATLSAARQFFSNPGQIETGVISLVILDLMLPDGSGYDFLNYLHQVHSEIPVLILSARSSELDKVRGLESGADDFIEKPFSLKELFARIRAVIRRSAAATAAVSSPGPLIIDKLHIDIESQRVTINSREVSLSYIEFQILNLLIRNHPGLVTRTLMLERIWKGDFIDNRGIDPHISRLRRKLKPYNGLIETVPGVGYRWNPR